MMLLLKPNWNLLMLLLVIIDMCNLLLLLYFFRHLGEVSEHKCEDLNS